jgi:DNA-directed RNA polymerase subunit beta'
MSLGGTSSHGLLSLSNQVIDVADFDAIKISIASPEKIRSWSYCEVTKPETINYITFKPERDGLFCARIFGPIKDYECLCGKYKRIKYKGIVCEKCGVEVTSSKVRRVRMGHVELAAPVTHIWFLKSLPSRLSTMLDLTLKSIEKVIYFEAYIVTDSLMSPLEESTVLTEDEYEKYQEEYGYGSFEVGMGAEAVQKLLANLDLEKLQKKLREELVDLTSELKREKLIKRLKLVENFVDSGNKPEWMIMTVLPVIPPDIRPLVMLDGGRFATSDLNELYRRVINRNYRLIRLLELGAPNMIVKNEIRMLQEAVDALLDNGRSGSVVKNANKKPFKSLSDMLKGKQGRFRQNLLGKRVDYSGRSVIVVGPELKLHQCGLPKKMALELFKPFIYSKLELYGKSPSIKASKKMIDAERPEVWDILDEVIKEHPVLLNRAPTLHRLGIQAFEPILTEGKAIQLHPLVCAAFNADFDGDQMAVHVPLSIEAQVECRVLMMSTNNILSPANGKPIIVPSQDIILGLYYITMENKEKNERPPLIADFAELEHALDTKDISTHDNIKYRYQVKGEEGERFFRVADTTPGRVTLYNMLPEYMKGNFDVVNKPMTKKAVTDLIDSVYRSSGQKETVMFCDRIMALGFKSACKSGISIGKNDMIIPPTKKASIDNSLNNVGKLEKQYREGLITSGERYNKIVDEWTECTDKISKSMMSGISAFTNAKTANSVYMMADSGARGSESQIKQVAGMRGLMAKPSGEIIETPIISNFKEGLSVLEYFISAHGARKGLADTALKTANSGYLTRRLVDVSQDCIITESDCGTKDFVEIEPVVDDGRVIASLGEQILGRVIAVDIKNSKGKVLVKTGKLVDENICEEVEAAEIKKVQVRSALTCETAQGVCTKCYGRQLSTGNLVSMGEAVGVVAAQSIGEPGTQLTMRTFHIGGAAQRNSEQSSISAICDGILRISDKGTITDRDGKRVSITRNSEITILDAESGVEIHSYRLPYGSIMSHKDGEKVQKGDHLAEWDPYNIPIVAEFDGKIEYGDLLENISLRERIDESSGVSTKIVIDWKQYSKQDLKPRAIIVDSKGEAQKEYPLSVGSLVGVSNNDEIKAGDIIAKIPKESSKTRDITGGLPRVAELFEARKPKNAAIISEMDGKVEFGKDYKIKRRVIIRSEDASIEPVEYMISKGKHLFVAEGDDVKRGDIIVDGSLVPHDILRVLGIKAFADYMVNEVQKVYRMQGVKIDDKHIEVILSMMLRRVEVKNPGDTTLLSGEYVDRDVFDEVNDAVVKTGGKLATANPVLLGITKASLQTKSFISAASFQETTKVLTEAAIQGKEDTLQGLKENIIVGRLIPAGTGLIINNFKEDANKIEAAKAMAAAEAAVKQDNSNSDDTEEEVVSVA